MYGRGGGSPVFRFRSSHHFAAPSSANFGIKGTLATSIRSSAAYGFEVPTQDCRELIGTSNPPHQSQSCDSQSRIGATALNIGKIDQSFAAGTLGPRPRRNADHWRPNRAA